MINDFTYATNEYFSIYSEFSSMFLRQKNPTKSDDKAFDKSSISKMILF